MANVKMETFNEKQRRLLSYLGWVHGSPLNDNIRGLLAWKFGTKGEVVRDGKTFCKLIPGCSVFQLHPATIANFIMFYVDSKVKREDLMAVKMEFSVLPVVERKQQLEQVVRQAKVEGVK